MTEETTNLITAREARKLAGPSVHEVLQAASEDIRKAAKAGNRQVNLFGDVWVRGAHDNTQRYKDARRKLEELGFTVEFYYDTRQFVNMYTIVKW